MLEKLEVKFIHKVTFSNNNIQIKAEKQLVNLSELINYISNKFNKFEKERQEKKKVIGELRSEVFSLNEELDSVMEQVHW